MGFTMKWSLVLAALVALTAVNWIYFKILKIALEKKLVDNPDARKLQKRPVPLMGGIAVFFGVLSGVLSGAVLSHQLDGTTEVLLLPVLCAMMIMLYIGAMDDVLGLSPRSRLIIEILVVLGLVYATGQSIDTLRGLWGIGAYSWWLAVPLTVITGVGVINAINMIDGVNGLSSGLCITCCLLFGMAFVKVNDVANAVLAFSMVGALIPFFVHNVFGLRSRMFIGDAGTMMLGALMTWFLVCMLSRESRVTNYEQLTNVNLIALALAILSVPVADTLRVMTMRMIKGKSPFQPDKTHLHHVFVNVGVSHFITAMSEITIGLLIVGIWTLSVCLEASLEIQLYVVIASSMLLVWGTYALLRYNAHQHTEFLHWLTGFSVRTHLGRTSWWKRITLWLDAPGEYGILEGDLDGFEAIARLDEHISSIVPVNYKEQDRKRILEYMKGKAEVHVEDIIAHSGAEKLRVYPILFEETLGGYVRVVKTCGIGAPQIVTLIGASE